MARLAGKPRPVFKELIIYNSQRLEPNTGSTRHSLFQRVDPDHLVLIFDPTVHLNFRAIAFSEYNGKARELTLVDGLLTRSSRFLLHRREVVLRIVLRREKVTSLPDPKKLLQELHDDGTLAFDGFVGREEAVVIEVADEEARSLIEAGRGSLSAEEDKLVKTRVKGSHWWGPKVKELPWWMTMCL